jgi:hypothetical protein
LRRLEVTAELARYDVELSSESKSWSTRLDVALADGEVRLGDPVPEDPPHYLLEAVRAAARTEWRNHRADGDWPRRITRWRDGPLD